MIAQFLSRPSRNGWKLFCFSAKIMGSKNACALEFACILGRNIKCSVIIIIIIIIPFLWYQRTFNCFTSDCVYYYEWL